ncbi:MAG: GtrA family protein [Bacillota bacterium]
MKPHAITKKNLITTFFQATKFGIVGVLNTAVDFVVFLLFTRVAGLDPGLSKVISYSSGVVNSYIFNSIWTFRKESRDSLHQKLRFLAVSLVGLAVGTGVVTLCVKVFGWVDWVSNFASICVTVGINFLGSKLFVFKADR